MTHIVYIPPLLNVLMQASWFKDEFTLYARIVLTPRELRNGKSRAQAAPSANGSIKLDGSPNVLLAEATTVPIQ